MSTAAQIKRIHTLKGKAGLKEHEYRAVLVEVGGGASSKDLDEPGAARVIAALDRMAGPARAGARSAAATATGPFAPKLQSLWISGWNLGVVRDRSDRAMLAWLRQCLGVDHSRFLVDAADARPAIEGLKAWFAREGGVRWPSGGDARAQAHAVVEAIATRLLGLGDAEVGLRPWLFGARRGLPAHSIDYATRDMHALANHMGERLRARLASKGAAA